MKKSRNVPDHPEIDDIGYDDIEYICDHLGPNDTAYSEDCVHQHKNRNIQTQLTNDRQTKRNLPIYKSV